MDRAAHFLSQGFLVFCMVAALGVLEIVRSDGSGGHLVVEFGVIAIESFFGTPLMIIVAEVVELDIGSVNGAERPYFLFRHFIMLHND